MSPAPTRPAGSTPPTGDDYHGDMKLLTYKVDQLTLKFDKFSDDIKTTYASKTEVADLREDVVGLKNNIGWMIKLIIGLVVTAVVGLVIMKGGVPR